MKYPGIKLQLSGQDGNAFSIIAHCMSVMEKNKLLKEEIKKFRDEATSGDYDHLLQVCMAWFNVS